MKLRDGRGSWDSTWAMNRKASQRNSGGSCINDTHTQKKHAFLYTYLPKHGFLFALTAVTCNLTKPQLFNTIKTKYPCCDLMQIFIVWQIFQLKHFYPITSIKSCFWLPYHFSGISTQSHIWVQFLQNKVVPFFKFLPQHSPLDEVYMCHVRNVPHAPWVNKTWGEVRVNFAVTFIYCILSKK